MMKYLTFTFGRWLTNLANESMAMHRKKEIQRGAVIVSTTTRYATNIEIMVRYFYIPCQFNGRISIDGNILIQNHVTGAILFPGGCYRTMSDVLLRPSSTVDFSSEEIPYIILSSDPIAVVGVKS